MTVHFAWVEPTDTTFSGTFARYDEAVIDATIRHEEGQFATASLSIKNPRKGLLATTRKRWAWISHDAGAGAVPLFFGRVVGAPEGAEGEVLSITLVARPADFAAAKATAANTLSVLPWVDPVFVRPDARADPDTALEARSALWHIDRVTHAVTVSDIIEGEDGTVAIGSDFIRDSLAMRYTGAPVSRVEIEAAVGWTQEGAGTLDISRVLTDAAAVAGTEQANTISTYTGQGLVDDWPRAGEAFGGGWSVSRTTLTRIDGTLLRATSRRANTALRSSVSFPLWLIQPRMVLAWQARRPRREVVTLTAPVGVQAMTAADAEADVLRVEIGGAVGDAISGALPIGSLERRSYFETDRGRQSLTHLALRARALARARARAVEVSATVPFEDALGLSCRKSVSLTDARLPGGSVTGKVVAYELLINRPEGFFGARVVIGCAVGTAGTASATTPVPGYVADGYVAEGWQAYSAGDELLTTGDTTLPFLAFDRAASDDGVVFATLNAAAAVTACTVNNGQTTQDAVLGVFRFTAQEVIDALVAAPTTVSLSLRKIDGLSFEATGALTLGTLAIPQQIDLEAA